MTTTLREAAQQALEALKRADKISGYANNKKVITALKAALAQQAEPMGAVLVNRESREGVMFYSVDMIPDPATLKDRFELVKVYTAPPQRKPLTEEEILRVKGQFRGTMNAQFVEFARAIEKAHGIGGQP